MVNYTDIIELIESQKNPNTIESMEKFGINVTNAYGIPIPFEIHCGTNRQGGGEWEKQSFIGAAIVALKKS